MFCHKYNLHSSDRTSAQEVVFSLEVGRAGSGLGSNFWPKFRYMNQKLDLAWALFSEELNEVKLSNSYFFLLFGIQAWRDGVKS